MTLIKKTVSLVAALVLILFLFAGCGLRIGVITDGGTETADPPKPDSKSEKDDAPLLADPYPDGDFDPLCWKVTKGGATLYLFGTIHIGDGRSESVLSRADRILSECDALAVEFDVVAYQNDPDSMTKEIAYMTCADGETVEDQLPAELFGRMLQFVGDAGYRGEWLTGYNIVFWEQLIEEILMGHSKLKPLYGMDMLLINRAYDLNIPVLDVESAEFQMSLLWSFSDELYIIMIEELLDTSFEEYAEQLDALYEAWLSGDEDAFAEEIEGESEDLEYTDEELALIEDYNYKLTDERNIGMARRAEEYLGSGKTVFFAVGAGHMVGDTGIPALLEKEGYEVERIHINSYN